MAYCIFELQFLVRVIIPDTTTNAIRVIKIKLDKELNTIPKNGICPPNAVQVPIFGPNDGNKDPEKTSIPPRKKPA